MSAYAGHLAVLAASSPPAAPLDAGDGGLRVGVVLALVAVFAVLLGLLLAWLGRYRGRRPGTGGFPAEPAPQTWHTDGRDA